jgi:hypothetical protein
VNTSFLSRGKNGRGVTLTTHMRLVPNLRMSSHTTAYPIRLLGVDRENFAFVIPLSVRFKEDLWLDLCSEAGFLGTLRGTYKHIAHYHGGLIVD